MANAYMQALAEYLTDQLQDPMIKEAFLETVTTKVKQRKSFLLLFLLFLLLLSHS